MDCWLAAILAADVVGSIGGMMADASKLTPDGVPPINLPLASGCLARRGQVAMDGLGGVLAGASG